MNPSSSPQKPGQTILIMDKTHCDASHVKGNNGYINQPFVLLGFVLLQHLLFVIQGSSLAQRSPSTMRTNKFLGIPFAKPFVFVFMSRLFVKLRLLWQSSL